MPDELDDLIPELFRRSPVMAPGLAMAKLGDKVVQGYRRVKNAVTRRPERRRTTDIHLPTRSARGRR